MSDSVNPNPNPNEINSEPSILMFSDIEGCQADPVNPQTYTLCMPEFYDKIKNMLLENPNLEVAFLGDYFDQGMRVYQSIVGLNMLLNNDEIKNRVHVILGNRDINKLRFCYELTNDLNKTIPPKEQQWSEWVKFYNELSGKSGVELVKHILEHSMGAKKTENDKMTGLYSFVPPDKLENATDDIALKYLRSAFRLEEPKLEDSLDILAFFDKCKIAHVFNGKVLLAHGGGFDPEAFFDQDYVNSFNPIQTMKYYTTLEEFRRRLSTTESDLTVKYDVNNSVNVYNNLLKTVLDQIKEKKGITKEFLLLQALGLKPDNEDARYKSLIQSCSQDGCSGQTKPLSDDENGERLTEILRNSGITHVSYGHKPVCFPVPLIYRRNDISNVTFISNDTSNANRSEKEIGKGTAIGTSVTFKDDGTLESAVKIISLNNETSPAWKYSDMFGPFSTTKPPPTYNEYPGQRTTLIFKGKKLSFNNLLTKPPESYRPLEYSDNTTDNSNTNTSDNSNTITSRAGGKRHSQRRKQHKSRRGSIRKGSNKTRHNKHKQTNRGRKARQY